MLYSFAELCRKEVIDVEKGEITVSLLPGLREVYEENGGAESGEE